MVTGVYSVNTYLVACAETGNGVVIDPGGDAAKILQSITDNNITIQHILNTHGHADHVVENMTLKQALDVPVCVHEDDAFFFNDPEMQNISEKELGLATPGKVDVLLKDGDLIKVGSIEMKVIHTPGHTPGSSSFLV